MTAMARHKGIAVFLDAAVWRERELLFLSVAGPREAVKAILAAVTAGKEIHLSFGGQLLSLSRWYGESRIRLTPVRGGHHGIYHRAELGEEFYVAREENLHGEALWASRSLGRPIPPGWWPELRPRLLLPAYRAVALRGPMPHEYEELVRAKVGRDP